MPTMTVGQQTIVIGRLYLPVSEVSAILGHAHLRNALRNGRLRNIGKQRNRQLDPREVGALAEELVAQGQLHPGALTELAELISRA